jgi:hypothetical protein
MQAQNTLNCKVTVKRKPYSNAIVSLRITATFAEDFSLHTAHAVRDIHFPNTAASIQHACLQLAQQARAASCRVVYAPNVARFLTA